MNSRDKNNQIIIYNTEDGEIKGELAENSVTEESSVVQKEGQNIIL